MSTTGYIEWCNENEGRAYPLSESASRITNSGVVMPTDILADACLIVPPEYEDVYCSSVRVTPAVYGVAFACAAGPLATGVFSRTAAPSYTALPLTPLVDDVSGWVVFGNPRVATQKLYVFDGPEQSRLEARAVRVVERLPVRRFLKLGGSLDVYVENLARIVGGLGLSVTKSGTDTIVIQHNEDKARSFVGPCDKYADAGDCGFPPIRRIAGVPADDDGLITLRFVPHDWEPGA